MKLRNLLAAASLLMVPAVAFAQPVDGFYVGAGAGYNWLPTQGVKNGLVTSTETGRVVSGSISGSNLTSSGGPIGVLSVGYGFGNGLRVEIQGDYRYGRQKLSTDAAGFSGATNNNTFGGFVNALYDFDVGAGWVFPYVGFGVGYEATDLNNFQLTKGGISTSFSSSTVGSVAGNAIVGASFPIPAVPGLSATAEFRFMTTFDNEKFNTKNVSGVRSAGNVTVGSQYNYAGLLGLRYAFYVPPPPPPPAPVVAPAPAPSRTYLVFFDWDKYNLTDRARQIIAEAAKNSTRVQYTRIEVNGYTDLSGTKEYNQKLSVRRAQAVAAELVKDGVPANAITAQGFGESNPLVPTAQGVREPQNRRVEIILK